MKNKCQGGIEFLIVTAIVLFFFTLLFLAIQHNTQEKREEREKMIVKNLALSIQDEINIAAKTKDGYSRTFNVPEKILGQDYEIRIIKNNIYVKSENSALSLKIENVEGQISKGDNIIKKKNNKIYLNSTKE